MWGFLFGLLICLGNSTYSAGGSKPSTESSVGYPTPIIHMDGFKPISGTKNSMNYKVDCDESETARYMSYEGCQTKTKSGYTCKNWQDTRYKAVGEGGNYHNYCRNPDDSDTNWCYTVNGPRWEYCDVMPKVAEPKFVSRFLGTGYCRDWKYLRAGGYPLRLKEGAPLYNGNPIKECLNRCAAEGYRAFYIRDRDYRCACASGSCSSQVGSGYHSYSIDDRLDSCEDRWHESKSSINDSGACNSLSGCVYLNYPYNHCYDRTDVQYDYLGNLIPKASTAAEVSVAGSTSTSATGIFKGIALCGVFCVVGYAVGRFYHQEKGNAYEKMHNVEMPAII